MEGWLNREVGGWVGEWIGDRDYIKKSGIL